MRSKKTERYAVLLSFYWLWIRYKYNNFHFVFSLYMQPICY